RKRAMQIIATKIQIYLLLPVLFILSLLFMSFTLPTDTLILPLSIHSDVDYAPQFPGGKEALIEFINKNLEYPEEAQYTGKEGTVVCSFTVNPDGEIVKPRIVNGTDYPLLNKEALRVIKMIPSFIPERQFNTPIKFRYRIPIRFALTETAEGNGEKTYQVEVENEFSSKTADISSQKKKEEEENREYSPFIIEKYPEFPGGEKALIQFINENTRYPKAAQEAGIEGKVICKFRVNIDGSLENPEISQGIRPLLDMEALRVINAMPRWTPVIGRYKPIGVSCTLPIIFRIPKPTIKEEDSGTSVESE
ncbi:MAG: energy transducer TonB, partial [Tannerellaceae bacterium]|nr:energy transducer TonB [Tannerellaceae bacterium]